MYNIDIHMFRYVFLNYNRDQNITSNLNSIIYEISYHALIIGQVNQTLFTISANLGQSRLSWIFVHSRTLNDHV